MPGTTASRSRQLRSECSARAGRQVHQGLRYRCPSRRRHPPRPLSKGQPDRKGSWKTHRERSEIGHSTASFTSNIPSARAHPAAPTTILYLPQPYDPTMRQKVHAEASSLELALDCPRRTASFTEFSMAVPQKAVSDLICIFVGDFS